MKKLLGIVLSLVLIGLLAACGTETSSQSSSQSSNDEKKEPTISTSLSKPDTAKWKYDADNDYYYQVGIDYCEKPVDEKFEKLAFFVPAAYMDATDNGNGTFTCKLNESAEINGYTALKAPIVMPIATEGYFSAEALTEDSFSATPFYTESISNYTSQGLVYVFAGCRGIQEGAPTGVTDLKAAIRYVRYCDDVVAGDAENIFVFGMSGGSAQAAILGASGDSELYDPYLEAIGAVQGVSDAVAGSMDWCPIINLDTANAEYEWMMGCTRSERSAEEQAISDGLANAFAEYVNSAGFTDKDGNALTLTKSKEGIYQAGTYYEYVKSVIEKSLNNYLSDTKFDDPDLINSYKNAKGYIDELNADKKWINYNEITNTATITSIADFANACKKASDTLVAFDQPGSGNTLFGYGDSKGAHFDKILADILKKLNSKYSAEYESQLNKTDSFGYSVEQRVNMYTPLYYLMKSREGYGKSTVAKYWRIRSGIEQPNTSVTTEINLALALQNYDGVKSVDFEEVWAQGHEPVERTGENTENFIKWVKDCTKG